MRKQRGSGWFGCNSTICVPMKDGEPDYEKINLLLYKNKVDKLRYLQSMPRTKERIETNPALTKKEKDAELALVKADFVKLVRGSLCNELKLHSHRTVTSAFASVGCKDSSYTPRPLLEVADLLWDNLKTVVKINREPEVSTRSDDSFQPQVGEKRSVRELGQLYKQPLGFYGKPNDPRLIGTQTTVAYREGGKAYSRRLFSKHPSTCTRGQKKSTRRNKRTKRRR